MKLTDILTTQCILVSMDATDKGEAISQMVQVLTREGYCKDPVALARAIMERENIRSTGIGRGLAVPHAKCDCCDRLVMALGVPRKPIDFASQDGEPVKIVALLASPPDQTGPHIQALARISRLMLDERFRSAISSARTADEIFQLISQAEV